MLQQLAELVGKNLNQLAGLGGLTFSHYQNLVLPCITEQIVQCQDKLAQRFLMEVRPTMHEMCSHGEFDPCTHGRLTQPSPAIGSLALLLFTSTDATQ